MIARYSLLLAVTVVLASGADAPDGEAVYRTFCAVCHDGNVPRAPRPDLLTRMTPETILHSLENGSMRFVGVTRPLAERLAVAEYLTGKTFGAEGNAEELRGKCSEPGDFASKLDGPRWNGWGGGLDNARRQSAAHARLTGQDVPRLRLKWAFGYPGDTQAYAQPTIAGGRLFAGSQGRRVYALDAKTGCTHWAFTAVGSVRAAVVVGEIREGGEPRIAAFFGDTRAYLYAVDALTGAEIWRTRLDDHPDARMTAAPQFHDGRLYVGVSSFEEATGGQPDYECCKFRGSVSAVHAATGERVWKSYTIAEEPQPTRTNAKGVQLWGPSGAGIWNSPTVDLAKRSLYVGTGDNYSDPPNETSDAVLAFDLDSGRLLWSQQFTVGDAFTFACETPDKTNCPESNGPDLDFGASPILVSLPGGQRVLLAGQKSGTLHALDPDNEGKVLWQAEIGRGGLMGGIQWGPAADGEYVYTALADTEFELDLQSELGLDMVLNPKAGGGLFAHQIRTGEKVWHTPPPGCENRKPCSPAQSAAVTVTPGVVFSGSLDGYLRAYSATDGRIIWQVDTARPYETVNGVEARGGSIDGPGPVIVDGMLYVNSGYGYWGGMPGNVLLAFGWEDE